jgi:hypothetical protein
MHDDIYRLYSLYYEPTIFYFVLRWVTSKSGKEQLSAYGSNPSIDNMKTGNSDGNED